MNYRSFSGLNQKLMAAGLISSASLVLATPALAHHPFGGHTPANAVEGFLSGLGHPVIGPDHLAFVVLVGLLAAVMGLGLSIPVVFIVTAMAGTGLHLMGVTLPAPEVVISTSVLLFGILLAMRDKPNNYLVLALAGLAGLFHGYAYGEAVVGADMGPVLAYLLGFAAIQLLISTAAYYAAKRFSTGHEANSLNLRFAGFTFAGIGLAFLSGIILA
jgi:urease accessory protein